MKKFGFFAQLLLTAITFLLISHLYSGFRVESFGAALIAAFCFGLVNALIRPILMFLSFPINFVTFGLFTFVINALMLLLTSYLYSGLKIAGFFPAMIAALLFSIINAILSSLFGSKEEKDK